MTIVSQQFVTSEDAKFGVPDWIGFPLIAAESSFQSDAGAGTEHQGLLQLSSDYPGVTSGTNRLDPTQNLDIGLPPVAAALKTYEHLHPAFNPNAPDNDAYNYVLTHSGHPEWDGTWGNPSQQPEFEKTWTMYSGNSTGINWGPTNAAGQALNGAADAAGNLLNQGVNDLPGVQGVKSLFGEISSLKDLTKWASSHPGTIAVVAGALLVFLAVSLHLIQQEAPPV